MIPELARAIRNLALYQRLDETDEENLSAILDEEVEDEDTEKPPAKATEASKTAPKTGGNK
jgi:hypothetical protein